MRVWMQSGDGARRSAAGRLLAAPALAVLVPAVLVLAACGEDEGTNQGDGDFTAEDIEEAAESAGARGMAEALRLSFLAEDVGSDRNPRQITIIDEAVDNLPGEPEVTGIDDGDGDGLDDDGRIEVRVNEEVACMTLHDDGDVDVSGC